jgi:signal transduction histidine kinase
MLTDGMILTLGEWGAAINAFGLAIPLLLFTSLIGYFREPYFRYWALSYLLTFLALMGEGLAVHLGRPGWLAWLSLAAYMGGSAMLFESAGFLRASRIARPLVWLTVAMMALATVQLFMGVPFTTIVVPGILLNVVGHVVLGFSVWSYSRRTGAVRIGRLLGPLIAFTGVWALAYPIASAAHVAWIGHVVAGVNHMFVGVGMVVFLVEQVAHELRRRNEQLQGLDKLKSEFLATVSHELRTPLTVIKTTSWLLREQRLGPLAPVQQEAISNLSEHTEDLIGQIDALLEFSQQEAGKAVYHMSPGDLARTFKAAADRCAVLFTSKGIDFEHVAPPEAPASFDAAAIGRVISNLLSNAAKFTSTGGKVTARLTVEGEDAHIRVADTGIGIAPEHLERIFERFVQADNSATRRYGGSGLGLAIARAIVEAHGGRIEAESVLGEGSVFHVRLPLAAGVPDAPSEASGFM